MSLIPRTLSQIEQDALASARERIPEGDWSRGKDNRARLELTATTAWHIQAEATRLDRDLLPDKAAEDGLERWGAILAVPREGPSVASRDAALRVRGTAGSTITAGTALTYPATGAQYQVPSNAILPAAGVLDVDIVSITTGSIARLDAGVVLEFDSAPPGVEAEAELVLDLLGGLDEEPLERYRTRVLRRFTESGALVTTTDWQAATESLATVDDAYIYPNRRSVASVDVVGLRVGRGATRALTDTERAEVLAYLDARRPISVLAVRVIEVLPIVVDVTVELKERASLAAAWDWGDVTPVGITAYDTATRTLTLASLPGDLRRGSRLVIVDDAGALDGSISTVVDLPGGTDVVIDRDYGYVFGSIADVIYPAGELTEPARNAILTYFDALGPAVGDFGGDWEDSVRIGLLEAAIFDAAPGVRDMTVTEPVADVIPADPPIGYTDERIALLIPGRVLALRMS